ncbi:MAG: hypothetical protein AB1631_17535, partial [Acidobacteriota bacterium]
HIMRCLAFADGIHDIGVGALFVAKAPDPQITNLIQIRGYGVETIPSMASAEDDARLTLQAAKRSGAKLIITDVCHNQALSLPVELNDYHRLLKENLFTICIAGAGSIDIPADIIVNPYAVTAVRDRSISQGQTVLNGPSYFIFRREFITAATSPREIAAQASRLLVTIGGGDDLCFTAKVIKALRMIERADMELKVVVGAAFSDGLKSEIAKALEGFSGRYELLSHDANLAEAMLWADLAITGDGLTKYETAVTGTPNIMLSRPDSPDFLNREFAKAGTTLHLGDGCLVGVEMLAEKIESALENFSLREAMSAQGKKLADGKGIERILAAIPVEVLR